MRGIALVAVAGMLASCGSHRDVVPAERRPDVAARAIRPWERPASWREVTVFRQGRPGPVLVARDGDRGRMIVDLPASYTVWEFDVDCAKRAFRQGRGHGYDLGSTIERAPDPVQAFVMAQDVPAICASGAGSASMSPADAVEDLMKRKGVRMPPQAGRPVPPPLASAR